MKEQIIYYNGSIQEIEIIPEEIKELYKTSWEIKQKCIIDLATLTGAIIMALGEEYAGLFSNNNDLSSKIEKAGEKVGEKVVESIMVRTQKK